MLRIRPPAQHFVSPCRTIPQSRFACQPPLHKGALAVLQPFPIAGNVPRLAQCPDKTAGKREASLAPLCKGSCRPQAAEGLCSTQNDNKQSRANSQGVAGGNGANPQKLSEKLCEFVESFRGNGTNSPYCPALRQPLLHTPSVTLRVPAPFTQGSFGGCPTLPHRGGHSPNRTRYRSSGGQKECVLSSLV